MPQFQIKNNQTGETRMYTGATAPTNEQADQFWNSQQQPQQNQLQQAQQQYQPNGYSLPGFLGNAMQSGGNVLGGLFNAVTHPITTVGNVGRLGVGAAELGSNALTGTNFSNQNTDMAGALGNDYRARYGGVSNIGNTAYKDPFGMLMDAATFLDGVGAAGKLSKISQLAKAGDVGSTINPINMVSKVGGKVMGKATGINLNPLAPFKGAYNPEVDQTAQDLGVKLPVSAVTNNKMLQIQEALTSKLPFGQNIINTVNNAKGKLDELAQGITNSVNTAPDLYSVGQAIKDGFGNYAQAFRDHANDLYNQVAPETYTAPAYTDATTKALDDILQQKGQSLIGDNNAGLYKNIQASLSNTDTPPTIGQLKQTLTEVGSKLKNRTDPIATQDQASLNHLYGALQEDVNNSIHSVDPTSGQALLDAKNYYNEGINKIRSPLGKQIANADPEKLPDLLVKPNAQSQIAHVKEIIGPEAFKNLQDNFLASIYHKSINKDGVLDSGLIQKNLGKYQPGTLDQMLAPQHMQELQQVQENLGKVDKVRQALNSGTRVSDGSQTMFGNGTLGEVGLGLLHPHIAIPLILGNLLGGKVFSSAAGKAYLTKGATLPEHTPNILKTVAQGTGKAAGVSTNALKAYAKRGAMANTALQRSQTY